MAVNPMGWVFILLAVAALIVGFIPILSWITMLIALPLSLIAVVITGQDARKSNSQDADKGIFWVSVAVATTILLRTVVL